MKKFFSVFFNKTNTLGHICLVMGCLMFVAPMFIEVKKDYTDMRGVPWTFLACALGLYLFPEKLINAGGKFVDRKGDSI